MSGEQVSREDARRIALAAQGLDRARPRRPGAAHVLRVVRQLGLLQLDYVNVVVPAHYQVLFSRLGPYERAVLDRLAYRRRALTEQWAHEASLVPIETWPLLAHRRAAHRARPRGFEGLLAGDPGYAGRLIGEVRDRGALTAGEVAAPEGAARRIPGSWYGSVPRAALEALFGSGRLAIADRRPNFARAYDLAERIVPEAYHRRELPGAEQQRELLRRAARACGVATAADLADYWRMPVAAARPQLAELAACGELEQVRVEGWREPAWLHSGARRPRRIEAAALLSPFDPLIWFRPRVRRLFEFDYRVEIFVPARQRRWGPYVLPFLFGDRLAARVDLRADRRAGRLVAAAAYAETGIEVEPVAAALAAELATMASWLGLERVTAGRRGDFARPLAAALRG